MLCRRIARKRRQHGNAVNAGRAGFLGAALLAVTLPWAAVAQEGLDSLVPLFDLYSGPGPFPAFDVPGIRCAALTAAQDNWARYNGGRGPSRAEMEMVQDNLDASFQQRQNNGVDIVTANQSVQDDLYRVIDMYTRRFEAIGGGHEPWRRDPIIRSDQSYCDALNNR